jgi:hypothetical protein
LVWTGSTNPFHHVNGSVTGIETALRVVCGTLGVSMKLRMVLAAAAIAALSVSSANATVTLIVNGSGILTGATGVMVSGQSYDVTFADGTCAGVYGSCSNTSFDFTTQVLARSAAQALLDQVFVDGPQGNFDSNTTKVFGCGNASECSTYIAWNLASATVVNLVKAVNLTGTTADPSTGKTADFVGPYSISPTDDTSGSSSLNWARFALSAPATSDVPEPATWAMMIGGFGMIGAAMRRQRKASVSFG